MSAQIDDLRVAALQLADLIVRSDGDDAAIANCHRLSARGCGLRVNIGVDEEDVGSVGGESLRGRWWIGEIRIQRPNDIASTTARAICMKMWSRWKASSDQLSHLPEACAGAQVHVR